MRRPTTPSTGSTCNQRQCHGKRPKTAGKKASASSAPTQRRIGEPPGRERIHVQPTPPSHTGSRKAVSPSDCSSRSDIQAPKRPIQLWGAAEPAAVLSEGSDARQVASERKRSSET